MITSPDHDMLIEIRQDQKTLIDRVDAIYKTLFGDDGRNGLTADVNNAGRDIGGLRKHVGVIWGCVGLVVATLVTAFITHILH